MPLPVCTSCGKTYPDSGTPYRCDCGGIYDFDEFPEYQKPAEGIEKRLWRYRSSFDLGETLPEITLGEGVTSLEQVEFNSHPVWLKAEYQNPTGSYKDRGSALLASFLAARRVNEAVEDSSGNAGASFAAYAARAGIKAKIFIPESASGPKRNQIEAYGANVVLVPGPRAAASTRVLQEAAHGIPYASHAYMPFGLLGIATIAYEIVEQLGGKAPGSLVAPVGHGGLLYGLIRGFGAMVNAGAIQKEPYYVGVQAAGCSPIFDAFQRGDLTLREPQESDTIAEGVKVTHPVRGKAILQRLGNGGGLITSASDDPLYIAYQELSRKGFFVEPTSALVWAVLEKLIGKIPDPIVLILSGSGLKTPYLTKGK